MKMRILTKLASLALCAVLTAFSLISCGESDLDRFSAHPWECAVGFIEFKESGKICYNFESEDTSVSYFKLLSGDRINMYTEEGEELGMIFDYRFEDGDLYIGEAKYTKAELAQYAVSDEESEKASEIESEKQQGKDIKSES